MRSVGWSVCMGISYLLVFHLAAAAAEERCHNSGPQSPRDITLKAGTNPSFFSYAPPAEQLNLCNIHFHKNAEHKGPQFAVHAGTGKHGGWKCNADIQNRLKAETLAPLATDTKGCTNVQPGDTIEVHWVFTSCNVGPKEGLGACFSAACANPQIRVESAVFLLVSDAGASDFGQFDYHASNSLYHQPMRLPDAAGAVTFLGSSTGPKYSEQVCSPYQVTWNVRPQCRLLNINTLHSWCQSNVFNEHHAHGVRQLVTNAKLLAPMR